MAYSKTPTQSTYSTERINLFSNLLQRSLLDKDYKLVNMMIERIDSPGVEGKKAYVKSRPGLQLRYSLPSGEARGIYYSADTDSLFFVVGNVLYRNGVSISTLDTSTGAVGFTDHVNDVGTHIIVLVDGSQGYIIKTPATPTVTKILPSAWTASTIHALGDTVQPTTSNAFGYKVTSAGTSGSTEPTWPTTIGGTVTDGSITWTCYGLDFPVPHIPQPIFLDGYIFLAKKGTQDVYNSDLNYPDQWTAGSYMSAEMYGDVLMGLTKNNNYIYAVGRYSIEYLYDAANATGSPLGRQESAVQQFGCAATESIVQTDKEVILVGNSGAGGYTVWTIDGFKAKDIAIPSVRLALANEGSNISKASAYSIRVAGQKFYVLNLTSSTFVYSFDTQLWCVWSSQGYGGNFAGIAATDSIWGDPHILDKNGTAVYLLSEQVFLDNTSPILCQIYTDKVDFGSINRKMMARLSIIGDVPTYPTVAIQWSDDDYRTWGTTYSLNMASELPAIKQLGSFRRRAFYIGYSQPSLFRIEALEVDINKGIA